MQAAKTDGLEWLEHLNDEQRAAACADAPTLLILAGAGTGKTTTLSARVAWLIAQGASPERILLLTFTRRAAREMVQRAETALSGAGTRGRVLGGTFHSIAHRIVRMHAQSLGLDANFGVLDAGDAADLLDMIREERGGSQTARRFPRAATLLDIYSRTVNSQQPLDETVAEQFPWVAEHRDALAARKP